MSSKRFIQDFADEGKKLHVLGGQKSGVSEASKGSTRLSESAVSSPKKKVRTEYGTDIPRPVADVSKPNVRALHCAKQYLVLCLGVVVGLPIRENLREFPEYKEMVLFALSLKIEQKRELANSLRNEIFRIDHMITETLASSTEELKKTLKDASHYFNGRKMPHQGCWEFVKNGAGLCMHSLEAGKLPFVGTDNGPFECFQDWQIQKLLENFDSSPGNLMNELRNQRESFQVAILGLEGHELDETLCELDHYSCYIFGRYIDELKDKASYKTDLIDHMENKIADIDSATADIMKEKEPKFLTVASIFEWVRRFKPVSFIRESNTFTFGEGTKEELKAYNGFLKACRQLVDARLRGNKILFPNLSASAKAKKNRKLQADLRRESRGYRLQRNKLASQLDGTRDELDGTRNVNREQHLKIARLEMELTTKNQQITRLQMELATAKEPASDDDSF